MQKFFYKNGTIILTAAGFALFIIVTFSHIFTILGYMTFQTAHTTRFISCVLWLSYVAVYTLMATIGLVKQFNEDVDEPYSHLIDNE